jgi:hypothetical protein
MEASFDSAAAGLLALRALWESATTYLYPLCADSKIHYQEKPYKGVGQHVDDVDSFHCAAHEASGFGTQVKNHGRSAS